MRLYHGSLTDSEIKSLAVNLIARWNFDDNSNTSVVPDATGYGRDLALTSIGASDWKSPATSQPGDTYSLRFPHQGYATNNALNIPNGQTIDTIAFWLKPENYTVDSTSDPHVVMEFGGDDGAKIVLGSWTSAIANEAISLVVGNAATPVQITSFGTLGLFPNTWVHLAFVWSQTSNSYVLYIDGISVSGTSYATPAHVQKILANTVRIGSRNASPTLDLRSQLDDVRLYYGALDETEIDALTQN